MLDILYVVDNGEEMPEKKCNKCNEVLPIELFGKHKIIKDGYSTVCKNCIKIISQKYRNENKEKLIERDRIYNANNKDKNKLYRKENSERIKSYRSKNSERIKNYYHLRKIKNPDYFKNHYLKNKERISEYHKNYFKTNQAKLLEQKRAYYAKNIEKMRERNQTRKPYINEYNAKNKEKRQAYFHARQAKIIGNGGSHTGEEIKYLKEIQDYHCLMCGKKEPEIKLTLDHIVPVSKGGGNGIGNCQMLCRSCNSSKKC